MGYDELRVAHADLLDEYAEMEDLAERNGRERDELREMVEVMRRARNESGKGR